MTDKQINLQYPLNLCRASAGTGKTYTLAAYYIGLLLSDVSYRNILAVTFTIKATAEMSTRILGYLYEIGEGGETEFLETARKYMIHNRDLSDEALRNKAKVCFQQMLLDYDNVNISTIDSFLQTLLHGLASALEMSTGLNTELDIDHLIARAVDRLLSSEQSESVQKLLTRYLNVRLDNESGYDIRASIRNMAKKMYDESVQMLDTQGKIVFDADAIEHYYESLEAHWAESDDPEERKAEGDLIKQLRAHLAAIDLEPDAQGKFPTNGKDLYNAACTLRESLDNPEGVKAEYLFRGLTDDKLGKCKEAIATGKNWGAMPLDMVQHIVAATEIGRKLQSRYWTKYHTLRLAREMELMTAVRDMLNLELAETNSALLAKTADTLTKALKDGDADFILEKAGIRYKHILLDEFQDTSKLQWSVFRRLLDDLMAATGNTLLIVGDIKQSIYRWRNGDWHIMGNLGADAQNYKAQMNADFKPLARNYRSRQNVVAFNLGLFRYVVQAAEDKDKQAYTHIYGEKYAPDAKQADDENKPLSEFYQVKKKPDGFVSFRAFPKSDCGRSSAAKCLQEPIAIDMFKRMEQLLKDGVSPSDMMVLVRQNNEARYITDLHSYISSVDFPRLSAIRIVSSDSFLLESSRDVQIVINALRFKVRGDTACASFAELQTGRIGVAQMLRKLPKRLPLYEMVSEMIRLLLCDETGKYTGTEVAYLDGLMESVRSYETRYGSFLPDFIDYWDDTLHKKAICVAPGNAIRIMTIHSSKGLQAKNIFVPFCSWPLTYKSNQEPEKWCQAVPKPEGLEMGCVPIIRNNRVELTPYAKEMDEEVENLRIDNLNMLYVALTRAEDNLFISAPFKTDGSKVSADHVGQILLNYCGLNEEILHPSDESEYVEYVSGQQPVTPKTHPQSKGVEPEHASPLDFTPSGEIDLHAHWSSEQVRFIQSQDGLLYTQHGEDAERYTNQIDLGNLCHEVFAGITDKIVSDAEWNTHLQRILDDFQSRGLIESEEQRAQVAELVNRAWNNPQMQEWFKTPFVVEAEQNVLAEGETRRPDRMMIDDATSTAIIIDYKFGKPYQEHHQQVRKYMATMRQMGYIHVKGYLWYAQTDKLIPVEQEKKNIELTLF